ncbi:MULTISPECIES: hypothetical protein [Bradyrhizobium]|uniref:Uncharacterized protein n=1 Tax=Bradyrhizobium elkanii TaxID=29448 RepID=A0A4U6RH70_BRAEL|nr:MULTISPECIES: hypothetical protein [Bradyrhizobium]MTV11834.1 hypothetical protein [Bradyrhizobium sp. BR2003]TKV73664.1 hypothetical protein FDV58_36215 [Bradyrhizobium elkanii]
MEERAARAIAWSRILIAERRYILEEMADNYRHQYEAAKRAFERVQKAERDAVANAKLWLSGS